MHTLLLLVGVCSALPQYPDKVGVDIGRQQLFHKPDDQEDGGGGYRGLQQHQPQCASNQRCVIYDKCVGGNINTDGTGTLYSIRNIKLNCTDPENPIDSAICCDISEVLEPHLTTCPDNEVCVLPADCNAAENVNTDAYGPIDQNSGISQQCNVDNTTEERICCNTPATAAPIDSRTITPTYPVADQCGVRNLESALDKRIGSNEAHFGEFPWQGMILELNNKFVCGASLIRDKYVVTAAHCVNGFNPGNIKVRLGDLQANIANEPKPHVEVNVSAITIHPEFNSPRLYNDIAVLELETPLAYQYHINSICLPNLGQTFPNQRCFATGWGKDTADGQYQYLLKKVNLPIVEHDQCQSQLREAFRNKTKTADQFHLDRSFMCAGGEEHKDTCMGDGGGPLACQDPVTKRYVLTGITSWHIDKCGTKDVPGVYVDMQALLPFVLTTFPTTRKCGIRNLKAVLDQSNVADNVAHFGEFPWQGIIYFSNFTIKCGASLIGDKWLVTAAHCMNGFKPNDIKVRLGEWNLNSSDEPKPYVDVDVAAITIHPDFNPRNLHNNIAVLTLVVNVAFQYHINTICLPRPGQTFRGKRCIATGWGKDTIEGQYQPILKKVELPTVEHHQCQKDLQRALSNKWFKLDDSLMCAGGEENKDACKGDGGGPLACRNSVTGQYVLAGITAFGVDGCGTKNVPGVYADVQELLPFVGAVIKGN